MYFQPYLSKYEPGGSFYFPKKFKNKTKQNEKWSEEAIVILFLSSSITLTGFKENFESAISASRSMNNPTCSSLPSR